MSKKTLLKGTAILTIAGILTRLLGFFYRIFLSNILGAENLGIYQLIFPVYSICYNIYATAIQTAISSFVALELGKKHYKNVPKVLRIGLFISISSAVLLSLIVFFKADFIASNIIYEPRSAASLKILAIVFPFCGITSCINGYYYGLTKSGVPATTQLFEQIVRVSLVYAMALFVGKGNLKLTTELAVLGMVIGEISSTVYNILSYHLTYDTRQITNNAKRSTIRAHSTSFMTKSILKMSVPLTINRLIVSILFSMEAILIPNMLRKYGLSSAEALSIYGIINGMAMPFIMFPSTVTNSLSVLLLPTISEATATNNNYSIRKTISLSVKYSLLVGILSTGIFVFFGKELGVRIFNNSLTGDYLTILAWICPFLYITTTFSSILNGLDKIHLSFISSVSSLTLRILLILFLVPLNGTYGYFLSLLVSQLLMTAFEFYLIYKIINPPFDAINTIVKPGFLVILLGLTLKEAYIYFTPKYGGIKLLLFFCLAFTIIYLLLLRITNVISAKDFK